MPTKRTKTMVQATADERNVKAVRLDLTETDYARLEKFARKKGLTKAAYSRMAVLEKLEAEEAK